MAFFVSVERLIDKWQSDGLIDPETSRRLKADVEKRSAKFSLGTTLATLGGLLLGAAIIMLVAANWQDMPRLMRIGLVFALIWLGYLLGAWRELKGDRVLPVAFYAIGASAFGGGIALVGQMYHLSGDVQSAALVWALGVFAAALLLRSGFLTAYAAGICLFYLSTFVISSDWSRPIDLSYQFRGIVLAALGYAIAWFTRSRIAAHMMTWFVIGWLFLNFFDQEQVAILWGLVALGTVLILTEAFAHAQLERMTRFSYPLAAYGLLVALLALLVLKLEYRNFLLADTFDHAIVYSILILIYVVGSLALCGRNNGGLRAIAYVAFSAEVLYLAFETVGSMIGTSGFFLTAGILVMLLAVFVRRVEMRFDRRKLTEAGQ